MSNKPPVNLSAMNRAFFEGLNSGARLELLCRLHAMTVELAERLAKNSTNSSKPPSSDSPFGGLPSKGEGGQKLSLIHISEPTRLGMISYAVFCLKKKKKKKNIIATIGIGKIENKNHQRNSRKI